MATPDPKFVTLDESHQSKHHPILAVGGFICDHADILRIEVMWREAKVAVGLDPAKPVRFSASWSEPRQRAGLFCRIGGLPIAVVVAMLEDFRPLRMRMRKETKGDIYVHRRAFEYVLQRLVGQQYIAASGGPHLVAIDRRSDPEGLHQTYADHYRQGWTFGSHQLPSLAEHGFAETLLTCDRGPLHEIADFLVSCVTGWAAARCALHKGKSVSDIAERQKMCSAVVGLLPYRPNRIPRSWLGWSVISHKGDITGKELLAQNIDGWLREVGRS